MLMIIFKMDAITNSTTNWKILIINPLTSLTATPPISPTSLTPTILTPTILTPTNLTPSLSFSLIPNLINLTIIIILCPLLNL
jgi:hypothetical protein